MTSFTVGLRDLRQALAAVMPHVPSVKDSTQLSRVRLTPFAHTLELTATDRYTAALALVSIEEYFEAEADVIDLSSIDVSKILAVFKNPAPGEEVTIRIATTTEELVLTDVSGLLHGEALILQRVTAGDTTFPEVRKMFTGNLAQGHSLTGDFWLNAPLLKRFESAQRSYGYPLIFEPRPDSKTRALVVRCADSFLGMIVQSNPDAGAQGEAKGWVEDWIERLPRSKHADWDFLVDQFYFGGPDAHEPEQAQPETTVQDLASRGDELLQAAELVITTQFASSAMLQRKMRIGLARARRVLDELQDVGVVGEADGSKARMVLLPANDIESALERIRADIEAVRP